jgi:hypothetical protein
MASSFFSHLVSPRYPAAACAIEQGKVVVLELDRTRDGFALKRGATVTFADDLVRPSFEAPSVVSDPNELAASLSDAVTSAGLARQKKWSMALPERATRTLLITMESEPTSRAETEEILHWKIERGFGLPFEELQIARERLSTDSQGRARYLVTAVRSSVLNEFETVAESLGWRAGLILPRSVAEATWLKRFNDGEDSLLVSSHQEGFTALIYRGSQPVAIRSIFCDPGDRYDELYRILLFYRDRLAGVSENGAAHSLRRLLLSGDGFSRERILEVSRETLDVDVAPLEPSSVGFSIPGGEFSFHDLAAPAGLATLAW